MHRLRVVLIATTVAACSHPSAPRTATGQPPDRDTTHAILDVDDKCGVLPTCGFQDEDGCPDVEVAFPVGSSALTPAAQTLVGDVATELARRAEIATLDIIGRAVPGETTAIAKARAGAVLTELRRRGARPHRLRAHGESPAARAGATVYFDVRCGGIADTDKDGIPDNLDACPHRPEDLDGHQDDDGCPESDPPPTCTAPDGTPCMTE